MTTQGKGEDAVLALRAVLQVWSRRVTRGTVRERRRCCLSIGTGKTGRERAHYVPERGGNKRERIGKIWSSEKGSMVDALELLYDEGRGKLREAAGRSTHPEIRG